MQDKIYKAVDQLQTAIYEAIEAAAKTGDSSGLDALDDVAEFVETSLDHARRWRVRQQVRQELEAIFEGGQQ